MQLKKKKRKGWKVDTFMTLSSASHQSQSLIGVFLQEACNTSHSPMRNARWMFSVTSVVGSAKKGLNG